MTNRMKKDFGSSNRFKLGGLLERTSKDHLTPVELDALVTPQLYLSVRNGWQPARKYL